MHWRGIIVAETVSHADAFELEIQNFVSGRFFRKIVLGRLRRFNLADVRFKRHWTRFPVLLHSTKHKGLSLHPLATGAAGS